MPDSVPLRHDYRFFTAQQTRCQDQGAQGLVAPAVYYSFFDSAVAALLVERVGLDLHEGAIVGLVVSSACDYFASVSFPECVDVAVRIGQLGASSVQFELAVFKQGEDEACAAGRLVQVFVDRATGQPVILPPLWREALDLPPNIAVRPSRPSVAPT